VNGDKAAAAAAAAAADDDGDGDGGGGSGAHMPLIIFSKICSPLLGLQKESYV
jgi:hypothetical protein